MSNKSLFNIALLKKDFKILFPLFWANVIFLILVFPFRYLQLITRLSDKNINDYEIADILYFFGQRTEDVYLASIFSAIICVIASIMLFANEKNKKTIEMLSVAPFSRKQIYINKIIVGLFISIIPNIIIYVVSYFIFVTNPMISSIVNFLELKHIFISAILIQLTVFSYYIMISMLFGSVVSTLICGTIFTFFPVALPIMLEGITGHVSESIIDLFMKLSLFARVIMGLDDISYGYLYLIVFTAIYLIAGYLLFEMYKMEKNSEFLTFKWTEPIFRIGVLVSSALLGGNILGALLMNISNFDMINKFVGLMVGAVVGYLVPKAIISRSKVA